LCDDLAALKLLTEVLDGDGIPTDGATRFLSARKELEGALHGPALSLMQRDGRSLIKKLDNLNKSAKLSQPKVLACCATHGIDAPK
jgi:hypothetical protein